MNILTEAWKDFVVVAVISSTECSWRWTYCTALSARQLRLSVALSRPTGPGEIRTVVPQLMSQSMSVMLKEVSLADDLSEKQDMLQ